MDLPLRRRGGTGWWLVPTHLYRTGGIRWRRFRFLAPWRNLYRAHNEWRIFHNEDN